MKFKVNRKYKRAYARYLKNSSRSAYARARYYSRNHYSRLIG